MLLIELTTAAVADHRREESGTQIARGIDSVACLHTYGDTDSKDYNKDCERYQTRWRRSIPFVRDSTYDDKKYSGTHELDPVVSMVAQ